MDDLSPLDHKGPSTAALAPHEADFPRNRRAMSGLHGVRYAKKVPKGP